MRAPSSDYKLRSRIIWIVLITASVLTLLVLVFFVLRKSIDTSLEQVGQNEAMENAPTPQHFVDEATKTDDVAPLGTTSEVTPSILDVCDIEEFPLDQESAVVFVENLEVSKECEDALAAYVLSTNPFSLYKRSKYPGFLNQTTNYTGNEFSLIKLGDPMTYERIFEDPLGDLERIIDAVSRPECQSEALLVEDSERQDSCNADAFTNFSIFYNDCYLRSVERHFRRSQYTLSTDVWQDYLANRWIDAKCEELNSVLNSGAERYPEQWESLLDLFGDGDHLGSNTPGKLLVRGAILGDEAASLTSGGMYFGRFSRVLPHGPWKELSQKRPPSKQRILSSLHFVLFLEEREIDVQWEWLVEHLCSSNDSNKFENQKNCRSLINDLHTVDLVSGSLQEAVDKFERIAIDLDVYD